MKLRNGMKLPDWVKWVARDENYELWCFTDEPSKEGDVWKTEYGIGYCERLDDVDDIYNDIQWDDEKPTPVNKSLHKGGKTEMKKDIKWLKEKLQTMINQEYRCYDPLIQQTKHTCKIIMDLIDQLDEPKKVVIPQFVADYIEKWKYEGLIMHEWFTFDHDNQDEDKVSKWLYKNDYETNKRRELMLIDAIRYGYEVEKEILWEIPMPDLKTTGGHIQYLTYDPKARTYFASRQNGRLKQTFNAKDLASVPTPYRHYAVLCDFNKIEEVKE